VSDFSSTPVPEAEQIARLQAKLAWAERRIRALEEILRLQRIKKYGPGSEKLTSEQLELLELEPGVSHTEVQAESRRGSLPPPAKQPKRPHRWLQRIWLVVFVLFCLEVGIILTVLPWTRLWTDNSLLLRFPSVKEFLNYNFVRGLVSGLGLVDIWMGVAEAVTYRETSRG